MSSRTFSAPPASLDAPRLEAEILDLWRRHDVEGRSLRGEGREKARAFVFYDGPPFATGLPHYGHLLAGTLKDIVPRFWSMRGYWVERRFGWDCHGLPIESLVENELGVHGRAEIEQLGVPAFNAACRSGVLRFTSEWESVVRRMGRWVDFRNDYKTMDVTFMESVWWVFRQLWDKGLVYEGFRVQPVSPALGTPLSNFEVAQGPMEKDPVTKKEGYKRRQDPSLTVRFALEDEPGAYLWAWTTTPWTLPSNLALAVHPDVEYVKVRLLEGGADGAPEVAYLEPSRLAEYQSRGRIGATEELARLKGRELVGRPYTPLLPYFERFKTREDGRRWCFRVVAAEYVTTDSGTGIVHQAPAFGEDDYQTGIREDLPVVRPVDLNGRFDHTVPDFQGEFVKDADKAIVDRLKREGKVVDQDVYVHPYPHCYRTEQPLLYMALSTWFMKVEPLREKLVAHNDTIRWVPDHVGSGRFGNWLSQARDWNLARNRYWGTPLPIWRCDLDPEDMVCVGSRAELESLAGLPPGALVDLHRESVDAITFPSSKTPGGTMRRVSEVFDCWFESGSMPYAQNHYPFDEAKRDYVEANLPADFIAEGLDQTRGWFYTLHVLSTALFDRPAFKNVIVNGLILAADGKKMSKRLKNYPDPSMILETYGADALRTYLIDSAVVRAEPMRFGKHAQDTTGEGVRDAVRLTILPLWNAYNFLVTYARADGWTPTAADLERTPTNPLDRWMTSRVTSFLADLTHELESYSLFNVIPAWVRLLDDLNNWYIRRGRRRYWRAVGDGPDADRDKADAYATLWRTLVTCVQAMAPVMPFVTEWLYQRLVVDVGLAPTAVEGAAADASIHLASYPEAKIDQRDEALERDVAHVRAAVGLALALREEVKIGVRRPLPRLIVASADPTVRAAILAFEADLRGELNVKAVEVEEDDSSLVEFSAKANFKTLGKKLGKRMKDIATACEALDRDTIAKVVRGESIVVEGETLEPEDVVVRRMPREGIAVASEGGITVVLDTSVDEALVDEGLARELVNRVQTLRKEADLQVSQRIVLRLAGGPALARALSRPELAEMVKGETLTETLHVDDGDPANLRFHKRDDIDGVSLHLGLEPTG